MDRFSAFWLPLLLLSSGVLADTDNHDSTINEHRIPRVSGRIVKVYSGNRPEPYLCNSEGYKADPDSCASFYRCVKERNGKLNVFRYQCAPGTVYDPDLETCNHPRSTRRTECGGILPAVTTDSTIFNDKEIKKELPKPFNTNKLAFQQSIIKKYTVTKAGTTSHASATTKTPLETTIYVSPFTLAAHLSDTSKQNQGYNFFEPESTTWTSNKQEFNWDQTTSRPKVSNSKNDDICSDDGFTGDTDNCRKFYRCVGNLRGGFLRYEFFCSESTIWDEQIQSCNHPWAVKRSKCGRSLPLVSKFISTEPSTITTASTALETTPIISTSTSTGYGQKTKTIQQQLQISHGSKVMQTQTQISHSDQIIQNQTQIHYGDRKASETKQNQTQIAHGSAVSQTQTQSDYGTKGLQTQLQIDHTKDSSQSQTQIHDQTTMQSTSSNLNNQCTESGFMGDSNDCKKFYRCVDNGRGSYTKYEYKCGEGTVWDQSIDACNHAWAVKNCGGQSHSDSQSSSTVQSTTTTQRATQSTSETSETDIDDNDVGYGNQNEAATATTRKPQFQTTKGPQYQTTKDSQNESNNNNECKSSGFMGDANNCKKFYRCVDNGMGGYTRHEFTCGEGTVWDTSIEACNHAWAVKSCGGSGGSNQGSHSSEPTATATYEETTTSTARPVDKTTENTDKPIGSTTTEGSTSTTTNTLPNTDNKCKESGFMGDNDNCKKFYRCVDNGDGTYTRYEFTCGEGTVWDSKIDACNHEWAVEKCGGNSDSTTISELTTSKQPILQDEDKDNEPMTENNENSSTTQHTTLTTTVTNEVIASDQECTSGGFIGDKNDCKKFYRCVENNNGGYDRYQFSCGEGTVWDDSILACNHAWAVKNCGATGSDTSQSNSESTSEGTTISIETDSQNPTQHTTEKSTSTAGKPTENEVNKGNCESEGFFGTSTDCKKFIRCVDDGHGGFTKYEFTCGEGTTWNQKITACDHPTPDRPCGQDHKSTTEANQVNDDMITETTTKMDPSTSSPDKEESQQTQQPQQTSSGKCESEGFYGDPSNCKKFYRCVDDGKGGYTKYDFTCGDGTVWNQEIVACDHESDDKSCLSSATSTEESSSQSQSTSSKPPSDSTISSSTTNIQGTDKTESPTATDECTSEGFFPHSHDCKKFVRCVNNGGGGYTRYEFSCGQGTVWVQEIQTCDHDSGQSTCSQQSEMSTKPQDSGTSSSSTTESVTTNSENQTENKEDDEYPDQTTKQPSNSESGKCTSEGYFGNKNDCRKFYRCVDNGDGSYTKYDFDCGEGTAWDSDIETCNYINEVKSCSESNKEENQTQQTMKDEEVSPTTEGSSSTTKGTTSSLESSEEPGSGSNTGTEDKCVSEGYFGDSKDCKKFYRCVDDGNGGFTKYNFTCADGTIWDQDITTCNYPRDVKHPSCGSSGGEGADGQSSSTGSSTGSTSSPESTSSSDTSDNSTQSPSNCSQEESSKKPDSSKDIKCDKAGYYPDPNDCKKFYRCVDWDGDGKRFSVYHFECGEGTIWDPALDTCNHEESVYPPRDCSQTQSQSETSEGTTQKQEETTTEESTTTQKSTTSEQTTTAQEETTTQQSTTSKKTTTEQSTTSEQTTTQQSTTSEKTTTQESTTSEQTTTQQSTTSEKTTTQESTTSEQTTTQQSTSEQTTTQQSTTSEQTTTQQSTSEQTTQESTTSAQTTQESTTSEDNSEQTTQEQTTEQTTTQESMEQTDSSNTDGTTEGSTTEADNSSTTEQSSTTGEQESTESSDKECPETEDDQYLLVCPTSFKRHPKYCNMFYQCKEDEDTHEVNVATFKCPNETIYDESQTKCVEEKEADKKCDGEMAKRHRFKRLHRDSKEPITVDKESKSCPKEGYYAFEKHVECSNGFLKCERNKSGIMRGYVHQCPEGFLFWAISKRCELGRNIRDCKRSSNDWTGRWNIPIDRKNISF